MIQSSGLFERAEDEQKAYALTGHVLRPQQFLSLGASLLESNNSEKGERGGYHALIGHIHTHFISSCALFALMK